MSRESKEGGGGGLSLQTLLISSLAAVAAAIVVPMFWERGSILATAITPIIVAVVSEVLNRPAAAIKTAAPRVTRRTATGAAVRSRTPTGVGARGDGPEQLPPRRDDPFGLYELKRPRNRRRLKIALLTGLLAFVIGAGVVTASELAVFGHSVGQSKRSTGLFGGHTTKSKATPTPTASPTETPAKTETATPTATPTVSATPTATPTIGTQQATPTTTPPPAATPTATP